MKLGRVFMSIVLIVVIALITSTSYAKSDTTYYISPTGSDNNSGTKAEPFKSLMKAQSVASFGDTVYIREGVYDEFEFEKVTNNPHDSVYHFVHDIQVSGITYEAYPGDERPVFDFSNVPTDKRIAAFFIGDDVTDVKFIGFDVTGVKVGDQKQSEAFRIRGQAYLENVAVYNTEANGFYFTGPRASGIVYNSDAYNNIGPTHEAAGNTDGFGAHALDVAFINNRAWNNSDDGFDSLSSTGAVIFYGNWAFNHLGNQDRTGDKNGFKVGGYTYRTTGLPDPMPVHSVKYNLSINNGGNNFYANHQPGQAANWMNNTASIPGYGANFNMLERLSPTSEEDIPGYREVLHNNIAYEGDLISNYAIPPENETNNSWTIDGGLQITPEDFHSLDMEQLTAPRKQDGSLPDVTFMEPVPTSPLYENGLGYLAYKENPISFLQGLLRDFIEYGWIENGEIASDLDEKLAKHDITAFIQQVETQSGEQINQGIARILVNEAKRVENTPTEEKTTVEGTTTWLDDNSADRPEVAKIHLKQNGKVIATQEITADSDWKYSFTDLERDDANGKTYAYSIEGESVEGYQTTIDGYDITNLRVGKTSVAGTNSWLDEGSTDRPAVATVHLKQNDEVIDMIEITLTDDWKYEFSDLEAYDENGKAYEYTIEVEPIDGYETTIDMFDITNVRVGVTTIEGTAIWKDDNFEKRPDKIKVDLLQDGEVIDTQEAIAESEWKYVFVDLSKYNAHGKAYAYTVKEQPVHGYESSVSGYDITNILKLGTVELINVGDDGNTLAGATFDLQSEEGESIYKGLQTDDSGKIIVTDLKPGNYLLVETKAPTGYESSTKPIEFTIEMSQAEILVVTVTHKRIPIDSSEPNNTEKTGEKESGEKPNDKSPETTENAQDGSKLPQTATSIYNYALMGIILIMTGLTITIMRRIKEQ